MTGEMGEPHVGCMCLTVSVNEGLLGMKYVVGMSAIIFGSVTPNKRLRAS